MSDWFPPGFARDELRKRYDVASLQEDEWHSFEDNGRRLFIGSELPSPKVGKCYLLNAGAGVHILDLKGWEVVSVDLFSKPLLRQPLGVCASVTNLPFASRSFRAVICLGEVLGYCDPVSALAEFARILASEGILILDFASTRSFRYWFSAAYGRAADLVSVDYNGELEKIWIYDPKYIRSLLVKSGFSITREDGVCGWAALLQRSGLRTATALRAETYLQKFARLLTWSDLIILAARRT